MAPAPLLLLPPSEGKAEGGRTRSSTARPGAFDDALGDRRDEVRHALGAALRHADDASASRVLGVRGELLERARRATDAYVAGRAPVLPASQRYTGVVWDNLGVLRMAEARRILVPSALYGVTTAADPIADYRLKFSVSLPGLGGLARWWRVPLTEGLAAHARRRVVVDLLPAEHAAAIDWLVLEASVHVVHVRFRTSDGAAAVGHDAKAAKGRLARVVLDAGLDAAVSFRWQGWRARASGDDLDVLAPG
jgi:cytoplasmic iron level regulating protein YaaA (DUF328/UPF0246 family)